MLALGLTEADGLTLLEAELEGLRDGEALLEAEALAEADGDLEPDGLWDNEPVV
jgi:hypothetical protein